MKQSQRIAKNVLAGGVALAIGGLTQVIAVSLVSRWSTVEDAGVYSYILAFAMFFQLVADAGLSNILVREIAAAPEKMAKTLGAALSLIWIMSIGAELILIAIVPFLHFSLNVKLLTVLMGVATLTQFHCSGYGAALRSKEDNEVQALGFIVHKFLFLGFICAGFALHLALLGLVLSHLIPNLLLWVYLRRIVVSRYGRPELVWDRHEWKYLLMHSLPVGGAGMLGVLAQQVDILVLKYLTDFRVVGLFSGPYRVSMALRFIPTSMSVSLYPMFSRLAADPERKPELEDAYQRSIKFFLLLSLPLAVLFFLGSERLIAALFGARYAAGASAMQWLAFAFVPYFVSCPLPYLLTALHEQRYLLAGTAATFVLRVAFNFAFIPHFGMLGPCMAFIAAETLNVLLWTQKLSRMGFASRFLPVLWRSLLASLLMGAILYLARQQSLLIFAPAAVLAMLVYVIAVVKLRILSPKDIELAREGAGFLKPFLASRAKQTPPPVS